RSTPAPSEASAKVSVTSGNAAARSASMPGACDPCPGNTKARSAIDWFCAVIQKTPSSLVRYTGERTLRVSPEPTRSVAQQCRTPGDAAAEGFHQQQLAALDAAVADRFVERQRHRTRRRVAVAVDGDD